MTISGLIEQLKNYPGDTRVLTLGYEGGLNDVDVIVDNVILNYNDKDTWYYGPHESIRMFPDSVASGTECIIIRRGPVR